MPEFPGGSKPPPYNGQFFLTTVPLFFQMHLSGIMPRTQLVG